MTEVPDSLISIAISDSIDPIVLTDRLIETEKQLNIIKLCLNCQALIQKIDGCNYVKCICNTEMCWLCYKIKYIENGCSDTSHNSH